MGSYIQQDKIPVTQPFLPPKEEYEALLDDVWDRNWLTNNGPLVQKLEERLITFLGVPELSFVSNGTIALQIAIKALRLTGEIITTPFTYVATTSSIVWEGCTPVFVDIDRSTLNIDPSLIEDAITERTSAILATHVFGNPCDIESIRNIADKYNLKIIYDAAHCFGTTYKNKSVYNFGDISTASFHATKLFHTVEGGALVTDDPSLANKFKLLRNFGHDEPYNFSEIGINGKNSEMHAAMGLINLRYAKSVLKKRKEISRLYDEQLSTMSFLRKPKIGSSTGYNNAYYPIIFEDHNMINTVINKFEENNIQARRYFYPSLDTLPYIKNDTSYDLNNSNSISKRILCLPSYHDLTRNSIYKICHLISDF